MYVVYVLYSKKDGKFYIGFTLDLKRRLSEHKAKRNQTILRYSDFELVLSEDFKNKKDALRREKYFKTFKGKRVLRLMLQETLNEQ